MFDENQIFKKPIVFRFFMKFFPFIQKTRKKALVTQMFFLISVQSVFYIIPTNIFFIFSKIKEGISTQETPPSYSFNQNRISLQHQ